MSTFRTLQKAIERSGCAAPEPAFACELGEYADFNMCDSTTNTVTVTPHTETFVNYKLLYESTADGSVAWASEPWNAANEDVAGAPLNGHKEGNKITMFRSSDVDTNDGIDNIIGILNNIMVEGKDRIEKQQRR